MDKYVINGIEIEYDTFDIDNLEAWDEGVRRVDEETRTDLDGEQPLQKLRRVCNAMLDFFDDLCGEGTAKSVFGDRINVKTIYEGYGGFVDAVSTRAKECAANMGAPAIPLNRAQRRAIDRNKR